MLLLVDGSSYLYRAFHALPDLRNRHGEPTGAIYGVLNMLRRLAQDFKAEYRACIFDAKGKTFRDALYPQYKAHRPPMPDELACQIERLHHAIRALGWPLIMVEGVEADDVIGTLVHQANAKGMECIISTGDKDLTQLVNPHVRLVNTMTNEILDEAGVLAKFGVEPKQIVDYLSLVGDSVDNVPGVEKVGPKTAVKWLKQYGSLDSIMTQADKIGGVAGENLRRAIDFLPLGKKLVTIVCDVPLPTQLAELAPCPANQPMLAELFTHLEFKTWLKEIQETQESTQEIIEKNPPSAISGMDGEAHRKHYETILNWNQLDTWLQKINKSPLTALDTETSSLDAMQAKLIGLSLAIAPGEAAYVPLDHTYAGVPTQLPLTDVLSKLRPWLESSDKLKVGQHIKYDRHIFANYGIQLAGVIHDTLLESYILESDKTHNLNALIARHLDIPGMKTLSYDELTGKGVARIGFEQVELYRASEYAAEDADMTLRVHQVLYPKIAIEPKLDKLYREIEMPVAEILFHIERNGVFIDTDILRVQSHELAQRMLTLEQEAHLLAKQPFNLNSPKQIKEILFDREKLPILKKTPTGAPSTDEEVLQQLALDYPLPKLLLEYRQLAKLKNTYTDKLPRMVNPTTGRVHTNFAQTVAVTGRLASNEPNLQNIPIRTAEGRRIRAAFIAPSGSKIVSADYSQIELRIMAHLSQDKGLLHAFKTGQDVHCATAAEIFGITPLEVSKEQRRYAKVINFGLIYGMSAFGVARELGIERSAAQAYIERYFARYPGVARYMESTRALAKEQGYVETVFGRRLWLPEIRSQNTGRRQAAERAAINAPMQGTAADLIKLAMIAVQAWLDNQKMKTQLILQVHDELVLEVPVDEVSTVQIHLPRLMGNVAQLTVPLVVDVGIGSNWDEAH